MLELSQAYVTGLLADLEVEVPRALAELAEARRRASRISPELSNLVLRLGESKAALTRLEKQGEAAAVLIADRNARMATLHQEIAVIRRRADDLKVEMERVGPGAVFNRLRRDRAKLLVQIEDREKESTSNRAQVEQARADLAQAETESIKERDKNRAVAAELDRLQGELPKPELYLALSTSVAARAHCRLFLDGTPTAWRAELAEAIALVLELHRELRAGKYRLDKNSDVVGGRATATAEAVFGATALGNTSLARELFDVATDSALLFDEIFNVFRVWCLGLFLAGRGEELRALLHRHRYALGLRGGYVQCFAGLLAKDAPKVNAGLRVIAKSEWELWQDPKLSRGAGVVNLGALAISQLAAALGLRVERPGPTVPELLTSLPQGVPPSLPPRLASSSSRG